MSETVFLLSAGVVFAIMAIAIFLVIAEPKGIDYTKAALWLTASMMVILMLNYLAVRYDLNKARHNLTAEQQKTTSALNSEQTCRQEIGRLQQTQNELTKGYNLLQDELVWSFEALASGTKSQDVIHHMDDFFIRFNEDH